MCDDARRCAAMRGDASGGTGGTGSPLQCGGLAGTDAGTDAAAAAGND